MEDNMLKGASTTRTQVRDADGNFLFRKEWLANYIVISEPGQFRAQVTSEPNLYNPEEYGEEGNPRYIVNVKAVLQENLPKLVEILGDNEFVKAEELKGLFLTGNIWLNVETGEEPVLPHKRQFVDVNIDYVEDMDGEMVMRITDIFPAPVKKANKVNLDSLFAK